MNRRNIFFLCLCLSTLSLKAQTSFISISTADYFSPICLYNPTTINAYITAQFNSDNKFVVEFMDTSRDIVLASYPAEFSYDTFRFTVQDNLLASQNNVSFRISSTSPVVLSNYIYSRDLVNRGEVVLKGNSAHDTLNLGSSVSSTISMTANNPVFVIMNDSSRIELNSSNRSATRHFPASTLGEVFIARAENSCGVAVPSSGKITYSTNTLSIIPLKIISPAVCAGSEIEVSYELKEGTIPASAKFKLRLRPADNSTAHIDLPASRKQNNALVAQIPESFPNSQYYKVAIVVDSPNLVSPYSEQFNFYKKPGATIASQSATISVGDDFYIQFAVDGPARSTIELTNGSTATFGEGNSGSIRLKPRYSETFKIKSLTTLCGVVTDFPAQSIDATVLPGIAIPQAQYNGQEKVVCENQTLRLPFLSNVSFSKDTKFLIEGLTYSGKIYQFDAKIVNDSIEFFLPHSLPEWKQEGYFDIKSFRARTNNPSYVSEGVGIYTIYGIPRVFYNSDKSTTLPYPQSYNYILEVAGGAPFELIDPNDNVIYWWSSGVFQHFYASESGTYQPKSVKNVCYSSDQVAPLHYTVEPLTNSKPAIVLKKLPDKLFWCEGDSIEIKIETFGEFNNDNLFEVYLDAPMTKRILTVKNSGTYRIAVSEITPRMYTTIYIKSTSPVVYSNTTSNIIRNPKPIIDPLLNISTITTPENPLIFQPTQLPQLGWGVSSSSPFSMIYTSNGQTYNFKETLGERSVFVTPPKSKVTAYTIQSASNECGTTTSDFTYYVLWKDYTISMDYDLTDRSYCPGEEVLIPFTIRDGIAKNGTKFYLQLRKGTEPFETVATLTYPQNTFSYITPSTLEGNYEIRVLSEDLTYSNSKILTLKRKPTATLKSLTGTQIDVGESTYIEYSMTGGAPYKLSATGIGEVVVYNSLYNSEFTTRTASSYQIYSVRNQCGYGSASGNVSITVKPKISTFVISRNQACSAKTLSVKYQVEGDIPAGEKIGFLLKQANGTKYELGQFTSKAGSAVLSIPPNLSEGSYEISCYVTNTSIIKSEYLSIVQSPDLELKGYTTINKGETVILEVWRKTKGSNRVTLTLSDGSQTTTEYYLNSQVNFVQVTPASTTTYTITGTDSFCGAVEASGSATVIVNSPSERSVSINYYQSSNFQICEKDTIAVYITKTGNFSTANKFTAKIFNNQGQVVQELVTIGQESPLKVVLPSGLPSGEYYRLKITASDPNTTSGDYLAPILINRKASASFESNTIFQDGLGVAKAVVKLAGNGPWTYTYGNELGTRYKTAYSSPDTLILINANTNSYKLLSVANSCGTGSVTEPSIVKIELILGTEEPTIGEIVLAPNPVRNMLTVLFPHDGKRKITLNSITGVQLRELNSYEKTADLDLSTLSNGIYLLKVEYQQMTKVLKVIKE